MVQRKVPNKPRTQADHVKSEKRLGNLKPTSFQNHDGKSRGPDMKKKMKRSRSLKFSEIETCKSSPLRKTISQPGKPPPLNTRTINAGTPQKQPVIRATDRSPNYMKATSSSEARRESAQVSSFGAQNGSGFKNLGKRGSCTSASSCKPTKTLTKSCSLKLARTLTKTPSFKPLRGTSIKIATVALCADTKTRNATCSSTLKDSKFPAFLMLNPGGTEAEGTSVMKVCPYTYCSLNGHHHTLYPPLKTFLRARRRTLKVQKSMKLGDLHPRRMRSSGRGEEEIDYGFLDSSDEERPHMEAALVELVPGLSEVGTEFFIEIYAKSTEDVTRRKETSSGKDVTGSGATDFTVEPKEKIRKSIDRNEEAEADKRKDRLSLEGFSDVLQETEIVSEEKFEQYDNTVTANVNIQTGFPEEKKAEHEEYGGADVPNILLQGVTKGSFALESDVKGEGHTSMKDEDGMPDEVSDMDWEEGQFSTSDVDTEADCLPGIDDYLSSCRAGDQSEIKMFVLDRKPETLTSDDIFSNYTDQNLADVEETTASSDKHCQNEFDWWTGNSTYDQLSYIEDPVKELATAEEKSKEAETSSASVGKPIMVPITTEIFLEDKIGETEDNIFKIDAEDGNSRKDPVTTGEADQYPLDRHQESTNEITKLKIPTCVYPDEQSDWRRKGVSFPENNKREEENIEVEDCSKLEIEGTILAANDGTQQGLKGTFSHINRRPDQEVPSTCNNRKWRIRNKKPIGELDNEREFNPRDPNFLPVVPDPEAEKVDLRHQTVDDRKNAEEWMLDYALQQTVTKLGAARKRKVALLVEAFETVSPIPKYEPHIRHTSTAFPVTRSIQACS